MRPLVVMLAVLVIMGWLSTLLYALRDDSPARFVTIVAGVVVIALMAALIRDEVKAP